MKELKGFGRVDIEPGETIDLELEVSDSDLAYFDPVDGWQLEACRYELRVGFSSGDLSLESVWAFDGEGWVPE